jgi:2'-5' RNA ligase
MKTRNKFYKANNLLLENRGEAHTVMVKIPANEKLIEFINSIPNEIIYEPEHKWYGKTKPDQLHITVLYGVHINEADKTKKILERIPPVLNATLGEVSLFECEKYDVLKIDVKSSSLDKINEFLRRNVEYTNDYDDYNPHVTLCYLKKGMGKEYVGDKRFYDFNYKFDIFIYSDENWKTEDIKMQEEKIIQEIDELDENLRNWFGKGKKGGAGGGGWDRYNTKGERIGKCGDAAGGEGKPKCLSKSKAASLRASGGKKAIAAAVNKKRREDPNKDRSGKAKNVATKKNEDNVNEKKDACYHKVRSRYKIWPSAYASGALVQCRKKGAKNWGKSKNENMKKEPQNEVSLGLGGGYGGAPGGGVVARGWAGTFSSPLTSTRLDNYPLKMRYRDKGTGNTIMGMDPYDSVNDKDLNHPVFKPDEIRSGIRYEMARMEFPSKDIAKQIVLDNLKKDPRYYSSLHQYFQTQQNEAKLVDPQAGLTDDMVGRWTIKAFTEEHPLKTVKRENINMKTTPEQEMLLGIEIEMKDSGDELLATKIANDNLTMDPQHYSKLISAGLVVDKPSAKNIGDPYKKSNMTPNTVDVTQTPRKQPEPSVANCATLVNRTTGAPMPNTVKTDMGTVPMFGAENLVSPEITGAEADATEFFLSKIRRL